MVKEARQILNVIDAQLVAALEKGVCSRIFAYFVSTSSLLGDCNVVYSPSCFFEIVRDVCSQTHLKASANPIRAPFSPLWVKPPNVRSRYCMEYTKTLAYG